MLVTATAWHRVMWYASAGIRPHSASSPLGVVLWRMAHRKVWSDSDGSSFVVDSVEFPKCGPPTSIMDAVDVVTSQFLIHAGDTEVARFEVKWLYIRLVGRWHRCNLNSHFCQPLLRLVMLPPRLPMAAPLIPFRDQISRGKQCSLSMRMNGKADNGALWSPDINWCIWCPLMLFWSSWIVSHVLKQTHRSKKGGNELQTHSHHPVLKRELNVRYYDSLYRMVWTTNISTKH